MGKGDTTRQAILHKVAALFNEKGYAATSMKDITVITGIQRGGVYNHFASKEELAIETFEHACSMLSKQLIKTLRRQKSASGRLKAIASGFAELYSPNSLFPCGCPMLNTAVEAKREMLPLRRKAQEAMGQFKDLILMTLLKGLEQGEFTDSINAEAVAAVFVSTLEGAMLLNVLYDDPVYLDHAVRHLHGYVDSLTVKPNSADIN